jgi:hypothetical protein
MKEDAIGPEKKVFNVPADVIAQAKVRQPTDESWFSTKATG